MDRGDKRAGTKKIMAAVLALACTLIGGAGIVMAPKSDRNQLKEQLERNEEILRQTEETETGTGASAAAGSASPAEEPGRAGESGEKETELTVIGDSVFLGAAPEFRKRYKGAVIDAKISRQVCQALEVAEKLNKKGKLGDTVIISLGVNGNFTEATGQELIDYLGQERRIYWVNAHGRDVEWQEDVNKRIRRLADKNDNLREIDWDGLAQKHADWFYQDGTHLNEKGQKEFAKFIFREITG